jgi:uncharacterized protein (TIGR00297 family)
LRANALSRSGALAALAVGTLTFGAGGWAFTLVLLAFFVPSVALSRVGRARKKQLTDIGKGGARDAWQVLANGGVATACAVIAATRIAARDTRRRDGEQDTGAAKPWIAAFAGAYAAATADTWGTEIGTLVRGTPHSILTFEPIATGLSGGVTLAGSAAEVAGALWIALSSVAILRAIDVLPSLPIDGRPNIVAPPQSPREGRSAAPKTLPDDAATRGISQPSPEVTPNQNDGYVPVTVGILTGGILGALADSVLGATIQELRRCPSCERTCETNPHDCGTATALVRGIPGFSNDLVNAAATLTGAAIAFALSRAAPNHFGDNPTR